MARTNCKKNRAFVVLKLQKIAHLLHAPRPLEPAAIYERRQSTRSYCTRRLPRSHAMMRLCVWTGISLCHPLSSQTHQFTTISSRSSRSKPRIVHTLFTNRSLIEYACIKWNDYNYSRSQFVHHQSYAWASMTNKNMYGPDGRLDMLFSLQFQDCVHRLRFTDPDIWAFELQGLSFFTRD